MSETYPNSVVRARTAIVHTPYPHDHQLFVDANGTGWTSVEGSVDPPHKHKVTGWVVQSTRGHTHDLDQPYAKLKQSAGRAAQTALKNKAR